MRGRRANRALRVSEELAMMHQALEEDTLELFSLFALESEGEEDRTFYNRQLSYELSACVGSDYDDGVDFD